MREGWREGGRRKNGINDSLASVHLCRNVKYYIMQKSNTRNVNSL